VPDRKPLVVPFTKMNGAGNDFIILDNRFLHLDADELAAFARRYCPRRTGVGADGLLALDAPEKAGHHFRMRYRNADGSRAGLCGNGARCLARFAREAGLGGRESAGAWERGGVGERERGGAEEETATLAFASDAGTHRALVPADAEAPVRFYAAAPRPDRTGAPRPEGGSTHRGGSTLGGHGFEEDVVLQTDGLAARLPGPVAFVNTGTPHAVLFVDRAAEAPLAEWGPLIRGDAAFAPEGANANVVEVERAGGGDTDARLVARTFEKGVEGETHACGTGALAAAVVAWRTGRVAAPPVAVAMPGGLLRVGFRADREDGDRAAAAIEDLYLEGPAEHVFQGTLDMPTGG
jgi:diaminopimelate epimerase